MASEDVTGVADPQYNLIGVLYHAAEGAWNYDQYIHYVEQGGDDDLASFFREVKDQNAERTQRAKQLLKDRVS